MKVWILISLLICFATFAETHRTRCTGFDRQYKPDGSSFVFEGTKYSSVGQIKEVKGISLPEIMLVRLPLGGFNNYMKVRKDDQFSEIVGIHVIFGGQQQDAPNRIELKSYFNRGAQIPSQSSLLNMRDKVMKFLRGEKTISEKLYKHETEHKYVGHISFYDSNGKIMHEKTIRLQCDSLSDNKFLNSELSDWDQQKMKDGSWVFPSINRN